MLSTCCMAYYHAIADQARTACTMLHQEHVLCVVASALQQEEDSGPRKGGSSVSSCVSLERGLEPLLASLMPLQGSTCPAYCVKENRT